MKVLIVKIQSLGDVVMALPMLAAVRALNDNAQITWVCGSRVEPLLKKLNLIDELIVVDEENLFGMRGKLHVGVELARLWTRIAGRRFDLVATGHRDYRYSLLSLPVRARMRRSWGRNWPVPGRYHGDEYIRLITGLEGPLAGLSSLPTLRLPLEDRLMSRLNPTAARLIAIAPGGARNVLREDALKRWALERYVELAKRCLDLGWGVVITGAASDEWAAQAFEALPIVSLIGKTSITDLVAVYNRCDAVVTHDSGPMHVAALAGARVVALFGPTDPATFVPRQDHNVKIIWGGCGLACRPCYDGKHFAACISNVCLQQVSVKIVIDSLKTLTNISGEQAKQMESVTDAWEVDLSSSL